MTNTRADLLSRVAVGASRSLVANDRAWKVLLDEKTAQVAELEDAFAQILMLCAESGTGYLRVEDIYEKLRAPRRQG